MKIRITTFIFTFITYISSICLLTSCRVNLPDNKILTIKLNENFQKDNRKVTISSFTHDIRYISLATDLIILQNITDIDFYKNLIVIADARNNCVLFDINGDIIAKIGNRGKGPGEYNYISDVKIIDGKNIYIQDGKFFLVYNLNGIFLRKFKLELDHRTGFVRSWTLLNDSLFIGHIPNDTGDRKYKSSTETTSSSSTLLADPTIAILLHKLASCLSILEVRRPYEAN